METLVVPTWEEGYVINTKHPSLSEDNEYVPLHSLKGSETLTSRKTGKKIMLYNMNYPSTGNYTPIGRISDFVRYVSIERYRWVEFINRGYEHNYYGHMGSIMVNAPEPKYLMTLAVKTKHLFSIERRNPLNQTPENYYSKFCLIIDRDFITNEEHFKVYRNVKRGFIDAMYGRVDMLYTNNLHGVCFNPPADLFPKFRSIGDMVTYTKSITREVLDSMSP